MAITTTAIHLAIVTTTIRTTPTTTILLGPHSNTVFRLYILRNIYSKSISIKEIYSFLKCNRFADNGKNGPAKCVLVEFWIYVFCELLIYY